MTRTRKNRQRRGGAGQAPTPNWTKNDSDYGIKDDQYAGVWVQKKKTLGWDNRFLQLLTNKDYRVNDKIYQFPVIIYGDNNNALTSGTSGRSPLYYPNLTTTDPNKLEYIITYYDNVDDAKKAVRNKVGLPGASSMPVATKTITVKFNSPGDAQKLINSIDNINKSSETNIQGPTREQRQEAYRQEQQEVARAKADVAKMSVSGRSMGGRKTARRGGRKTARRGGRKTARRGGRKTARRGGRRR